MRALTVLERALGLQGLRVLEVRREGDLVVLVARRAFRRRTCSGCGRWVRGTYDRHVRRWRHLGLFGRRTVVEADVRRVACRQCGVRVEAVPWARPGADFTRPLEDAVAWLTRRANRTAVARWFAIGWATVGAIVERVVAEGLPADRLEGLTAIGVDDFHYGRSKVLTLVVDHGRGRLIWGAEGKSAEVLGQFFDLLGPERAAGIRLVSMDMDGGYTKAVQERLPQAEIVYDPFHVTRLVTQALDEVRLGEQRAATTSEARRGVRGLRYALRKNPWNLTRRQGRRLRDLERANRRLYRGYLLKESLLHVYDFTTASRAGAHLRRVIGWAVRSRLRPFARVARTLRSRLGSVVGYVTHGLSNARLEATCRHLRMLSARAYGFHSAAPLLAMGFLYCGGVEVQLPW